MTSYRCILTAVLGICCRRNLKLFCHYAYAIWLPDLGNMLLVGFASFEQAAGRVERVIDTLQLYLCSFPERYCVHQDDYSGSLLCSSLFRHVLTMCSFGVAHTI
jgi:hypothetical protein